MLHFHSFVIFLSTFYFLIGFETPACPSPYLLIGCIQEVKLYPLGTTGLDTMSVKLLTEIGHKLFQCDQYCHLKPLKVTPKNSTESTQNLEMVYFTINWNLKRWIHRHNFQLMYSILYMNLIKIIKILKFSIF